MATTQELMGMGLPSKQAQCLGFNVATGLSGAGTNQATATALTGDFNIFSTVNSSTGAILPNATEQDVVFVFNGGANALAVYPASGQSINNSSANSSFSVSAGKGAIFFAAGTRWGAVLSA